MQYEQDVSNNKLGLVNSIDLLLAHINNWAFKLRPEVNNLKSNYKNSIILKFTGSLKSAYKTFSQYAFT